MTRVIRSAMPGLSPPVSPGMLDQVMGPAPQRPGRSALVASGVFRSPRAWEDVLCLIFDAPRFLADRRPWQITVYGGRNTVQTPLPSCSPGQVCGYICPPEAVYPTGKRVLGCDFTKTRSPGPKLFSIVRCDPIPARGRGTCLTAETRQTDSESASLASHTD